MEVFRQYLPRCPLRTIDLEQPADKSNFFPTPLYTGFCFESKNFEKHNRNTTYLRSVKTIDGSGVAKEGTKEQSPYQPFRDL